jgi:hypothetical protein
VDTLPPPSPHPLLGYAPLTKGSFFPDARLTAQTAHTAVVGDPFVAHRRHDAHSEPSPHELPVEQLPPPPLDPPAGYALPTLGPLFPEAPPHHVPASRGRTHPYGPPPAVTGHSPFHGGPPPPLPSLAGIPLLLSAVVTPPVATVAQP